MVRQAKLSRETRETKISVEIDLDDTGYDIRTPIPFFTHMLETFARHAEIKLVLSAEGDVEVDEHHTVEDTAIVIGSAIEKALGDKRGIERFGDAIVPMDESVTLCGIDISGRGVFRFDGEIDGEINNFKAENFLHFFETLSRESGINIYLNTRGRNLHHMMESAFKAFALSFKRAIKIRGDELRSTKGVLN
ncbi:imidazoleglycerol-phosphate dehydratase HisB [Archaeoglobus sulfaticallidus]|uniref:imidazoleglycerol-phosphate dehydratase HisB n=1 Tax=Archaeoglobus sulfaticallidus TaxID=1316941 RepID=UPI00064EF65E